MKTRNILAMLITMLAIGSALASEFMVPQIGWSRKTDVPIQLDYCEARDVCDGTTRPCRVIFDHDGNANTQSVNINLYDETCQVQLAEN